MIKVEVVFDGDVMHLNGYEFYDQFDEVIGVYEVIINGEKIDGVNSLEDAIKYCMEN